MAESLQAVEQLLEQLEKFQQAATPLPWTREWTWDLDELAEPEQRYEARCEGPNHVGASYPAVAAQVEADNHYMVLAVNCMPQLIAELRRLRAYAAKVQP